MNVDQTVPYFKKDQLVWHEKFGPRQDQTIHGHGRKQHRCHQIQFWTDKIADVKIRQSFSDRYLAGDESQIWMLLSGDMFNETEKRREK